MPISASSFIGLPTIISTVPMITPVISHITTNPNTNKSLLLTKSYVPTVLPSNNLIPFETVGNLNQNNNLSLDLAVGLIVGTLGALGLFLSVAFYLRSLRSGKIGWIAFLFRLPVSSVSALLLTCAAIGLVSAWAQNGNTDRETETGFLGTPNWRDNTLAWHVLLMVGGFFCAQVVAVCCWSAVPPPSHPTPCSLPKAMHGLLQVAAMSAMIAGLYAIVRHMFESKAPSLTTMHSWVGVASIAVYGVAMLWGAGGAIVDYYNCKTTVVIVARIAVGSAALTAWLPKSFLRVAFDLRLLHKVSYL